MSKNRGRVFRIMNHLAPFSVKFLQKQKIGVVESLNKLATSYLLMKGSTIAITLNWYFVGLEGFL